MKSKEDGENETDKPKRKKWGNDDGKEPSLEITSTSLKVRIQYLFFYNCKLYF